VCLCNLWSSCCSFSDRGPSAEVLERRSREDGLGYVALPVLLRSWCTSTNARPRHRRSPIDPAGSSERALLRPCTVSWWLPRCSSTAGQDLVSPSPVTVSTGKSFSFSGVGIPSADVLCSRTHLYMEHVTSSRPQALSSGLFALKVVGSVRCGATSPMR